MGLFQTFDDEGRLQLDCDLFTHQLRMKGSGASIPRKWGNTAPSSVEFRIPAAYTVPLVGFECVYGIGMLATTRDPSTGETVWQGVCAGPPGTTFNYWVFDTSANLPRDAGLFELYAEDGRTTFSSGAAPMIGVAVLSIGSTEKRNLAFFDKTAGIQASFPGRRMCWVQGMHGGHQLQGQWQGYKNGVLVREAGETGGIYDWRYRNDGKVYGGRVEGSTVFAAAISFDDVTITAGSGRYETVKAQAWPDWIAPITGFAVDVTNL